MSEPVIACVKCGQSTGWPTMDMCQECEPPRPPKRESYVIAIPDSKFGTFANRKLFMQIWNSQALHTGIILTSISMLFPKEKAAVTFFLGLGIAAYGFFRLLKGADVK